MLNETRAVLFDFGGTLYDYKTIGRADLESLVELARAAGIEAPPEEIQRAHREALREVFRDYLPRPYYFHRDMFRDALAGMAKAFGARLSDEHVDRYRRRQWELHKRDFALREGVRETLAELRRRRLHLGIVSNIDDDQLLFMGELAALRDHFDSILSSEEARSCKPDPGIFREALRRAACEPREALFVGDSIDADVGGANGVGIPSVLLWHRDDLPVPERGPKPSHVIRRIPELLELVA